MENAQTLFDDLKKHVAHLEESLIKRFLSLATANPAEYDLPVRAYCVLTHAALEDYLECIALYVMKQSIEDYVMRKKVRDTLLMLVAYQGLTIKIDDDEKTSETRTFDQLRLMLEEARTRFSQAVHQNHGISVKYMRRLLIPVAIDIKQDINLKNSLIQLSKQRGTFAHKRRAQKVLAPEDAKGFVTDCLEMCKHIKERTTEKFL